MVSPLYSISDIVYILVLLIILIHDIRLHKKVQNIEKAFRTLVIWVIIFCTQDVFWGLTGSGVISGDRAFFVSSTIFHLSAALTTIFWLNYVMVYLADRLKYKKIYIGVVGILYVIQLFLIARNISVPTIFYIENGIYHTAALRPIAFFCQYSVYVIIGGITIVNALRERDTIRNKYFSVFMFVLAPIVAGVFQLFFPEAPYHSMGYFVGCFIIHIFVVSQDRDELKQLQYEKEVNEDKQTGIYNRRAYEEYFKAAPLAPEEDDFVYISADLNGLKAVNDNLGHAAGDELIKAASDILKQCLNEYGKVYRIGGDEFAAVIHADKEQLEIIKANLNRAIENWSGDQVKELSMSVGVVTKDECPNKTYTEVAKEADARMYQSKAEYYKNRGIDRQGQHEAFEALCNSYTKILEINLTEDTYHIIFMDLEEKNEEMGFADTISEWLYNFAASGQVHEADLKEYYRQTDINYMREYFNSEKLGLNIVYRRKSGDKFYQTKMELLPTKNYSSDNQTVYLYVKNIEK